MRNKLAARTCVNTVKRARGENAPTIRLEHHYPQGQRDKTRLFQQVFYCDHTSALISSNLKALKGRIYLQLPVYYRVQTVGISISFSFWVSTLVSQRCPLNT